MEDPELKASSSSLVDPAASESSNLLFLSQAPVPSSETTLPHHVASHFLLWKTENCATSPGNPLIEDAPGRSKGAAPEEIPKPTEVIARGIASVFGPVMKDFDARVDGALKSQSVLASSIDRLTRELDKLLEDAPIPFVAQHAVKLSGVRKRVLSLNSSLQTIQKRMDNIERMLSGYALKTMAKGKHGRAPSVGLIQDSLAASLPTQVTSARTEVYPVNLHDSRNNKASQKFMQDEKRVQYQQPVSYDANSDGIVEEINSQIQETIEDSAPFRNGLDVTGFSEAGNSSPSGKPLF